MVEILDELKYTKEHEWARIEDDLVVIGITDYAQDALGEIVYIELPSEGDEVTKGNPFGAVESTKSVSDLYAPISGEVVEVNEALLDSPEVINEDPYGEGWMIKVKPYDIGELQDLMDSEEYTEFIEKESERLLKLA
jgi:glycine cleavage system H protein